MDREEVEEVGLMLCHSSAIRKLSFTGSTPVGKWLMRESASTVKRVIIACFGCVIEPFLNYTSIICLFIARLEVCVLVSVFMHTI